MTRSATQQAGIAAEAVDALNQCLRAALTGEDDPGITRVRDAYEVAASMKLMATRLALMSSEMTQLIAKWNKEGRLCTETALDTDAKVAEFDRAMTDAHRAARALFLGLDDGSRALGPVGWQAPASPAATPSGTA